VLKIVQGGADFNGHQHQIDLATCVNAMGPPISSIDVAQSLEHHRQLLVHPFHATDAFLESYARFLGVEAQSLVAGRGITELIHSVIQVYGRENTGFVTPDYTDFNLLLDKQNIAAICAPERERALNALAKVKQAVILSNPCNPTGVAIEASRLRALCLNNPSTMFVVDESYVEFTAEPAKWSMLGSELHNVIVLRSPTKCFGMGGIRVGAAWTREPATRKTLASHITKWPLSTFDSHYACAALERQQWKSETTQKLLVHAAAMEEVLCQLGFDVISNSPTHFRFVLHPHPAAIFDQLRQHGIFVRTKTAEEGVQGFRVTAPTCLDHLPTLERALQEVSCAG
jgi:histidinol-phosphate/aromatic aminotransferase/cobyric acid decarboxylase-like protein